MIAAAASDALDRIAALRKDLLHAYESGFEPHDPRIAATGSRSVRSLDPLSVVAPADTYFIADGGPGAAQYTRDGSFAVRDGALRFSDGRPVLGFALGERGGTLAPLRVDPIDAALGRAADARIESDGTFAYTRTSVDPRSGIARTDRVPVGRIALARFPAGTRLAAVDAKHVSPSGVLPEIGTPGDAGFAPLATHARDPGRLNFEAGLQRLQEAYLSFEALQTAFMSGHTAAKTVMDLLK